MDLSSKRIFSTLISACLGSCLLLNTVSVSSAQMMNSEDELQFSAADIQFFESKVRPLLITHCQSCHASNSDRIRGGLVLDTRAGWQVGGISGPAIIPGDPDGSLFIQAIRWDDEDFQMPPKRRLSDRDIGSTFNCLSGGDRKQDPTSISRQPASFIQFEMENQI